MQTFEEILQQEMAQPVRIKGSDATVKDIALPEETNNEQPTEQ